MRGLVHVDDILTVEELASILSLNPQTIYRKVRQRQLPAICIGRTIRFFRRDVEPFIVEQQERRRRATGRRQSHGRAMAAIESMPASGHAAAP